MTAAPPDLVQHYIDLCIERDRHAAAGRPTPPELASEIQRFERNAEQHLDPETLYAVGQHVSREVTAASNRRADALETGRALMREHEIASALRSMSAGQLGQREGYESTDQIVRLTHGKPVKIPTNAVRFDETAYNELIQERYGMSAEEREAQLDQALEAGGSSTARGRELMERYDISKDDERDWEENGLKIALQKRMAERDRDIPDETEFTPREPDVRHAAVIAAFAKHDAPEESPDYVQNSSSLYDDLQAAWDEVEARDAAQEVFGGPTD